MHDAIALANLIYAMPMKTSKEVTQVFKEYRTERLPAVMVSFNMSKQMSMIAEKGIIGAIVLYLVNHIPFWLWKLSVSVISINFFVCIFYMN
jgi:2-polyprenyl-6-methoxyphenol hydroxylase-like FAD-dependent oxidoreductase